MSPKVIEKLEATRQRQKEALRRTERRLQNQRRKESRRQTMSTSRGCFALGCAIGADIRNWPEDARQRFLEFLDSFFTGRNRAIALTGFSRIGCVHDKTDNSWRIRWGVAALRMLRAGLISAARVEAAAHAHLHERRRALAIRCITENAADASSGQSHPLAMPPPSPRADRKASAVIGKAEADRTRTPTNSTRATNSDLAQALAVLGEIVEHTSKYARDRAAVTSFWRTYLAAHHEDRDQFVASGAVNALENGCAMDARWQERARVAWGRALCRRIQRHPETATVLRECSRRFLSGAPLTRALQAIEVVLAYSTARAERPQ